MFGPPKSVAITTIPGKLDLYDGSVRQLNEALIDKNKRRFVSTLQQLAAAKNLDFERVFYALTVCREAMRSGSSQAIKEACLNIIGAQYFE